MSQRELRVNVSIELCAYDSESPPRCLGKTLQTSCVHGSIARCHDTSISVCASLRKVYDEHFAHLRFRDGKVETELSVVTEDRVAVVLGDVVWTSVLSLACKGAEPGLLVARFAVSEVGEAGGERGEEVEVRSIEESDEVAPQESIEETCGEGQEERSDEIFDERTGQSSDKGDHRNLIPSGLAAEVARNA